MKRSELNKLKEAAISKKEKSADLDAVLSHLSKLESILALLPEGIRAVLEKYGHLK